MQKSYLSSGKIYKHVVNNLTSQVARSASTLSTILLLQWQDLQARCQQSYLSSGKIYKHVVNNLTSPVARSTSTLSSILPLQWQDLQAHCQQSYLSSGKIYKHVVEMPISQANNVANHGHDSSGAGVGLSHLPPLPCSRTAAPHLPFMKHKTVITHKF